MPLLVEIPYHNGKKHISIPKYVQWAKTRIKKQNACKADLLAIDFQYGVRLADDMICAGNDETGKDICKGDSGGPLACVQNGTMILAGIASNGHGCSWQSPNGGRPQSIFTRISSHMQWINMHRENRTYSPLGCWKLDRKGDGVCDDRNNYAECEYDDGDCCKDKVKSRCRYCECKPGTKGIYLISVTKTTSSAKSIQACLPCMYLLWYMLFVRH